jgi:hypothetical protein
MLVPLNKIRGCRCASDPDVAIDEGELCDPGDGLGECKIIEGGIASLLIYTNVLELLKLYGPGTSTPWNDPKWKSKHERRADFPFAR